MEKRTIESPVTTEIVKQSVDIVKEAGSLVVCDNDSLMLGANTLRKIKDVRGRIAETFDSPIKAAHLAHKSMITAKKRHDDPLAEAERVIKRKVGRYQQQQEQIRRDEESRLRAIEQKREEERRLQEAEALEAQGRQEEAEQVLEEPIIAAPIVVPTSTPKLAGVFQRESWKFRIVNEAALPREYMSPDMVKIGARVRTMKRQACIPGVEAYPESTVSVRG